MQKEISQAVIRRMPRYYRYLGELLDAGVERISSNELSVRTILGVLVSRDTVIMCSICMRRLEKSLDLTDSTTLS